MSEQIPRERAVAEAATRGAWTAHITNRRSPEVYTDAAPPNTPNPLIAGTVLRKNDAAFIAHFNPARVLELLDEVTDLRAKLAAAEVERDTDIREHENAYREYKAERPGETGAEGEACSEPKPSDPDRAAVGFRLISDREFHALADTITDLRAKLAAAEGKRDEALRRSRELQVEHDGLRRSEREWRARVVAAERAAQAGSAPVQDGASGRDRTGGGEP